MDLKMVITTNLTSAKLQSDAIFDRIKDRVTENPSVAKSINGIFAYKITQNGVVSKEWSKF